MSEDNKPKFELPPRMYYTLEQAAKELGCDADYLLHLGATRRLELLAGIPNDVMFAITTIPKSDIQNEIRGDVISTETTEQFPCKYEGSFKAKFFTLYSNTSAAVECSKQASIWGWRSIWDFSPESSKLEEVIIPFDNDKSIQWFGSFYEPVTGLIDLSKTPPYKEIIVTQETMFISADELVRIKSVNIPAMPDKQNARLEYPANEMPIIQSSEDKHLRIIGAMGIYLASKSGQYRNGDKPNAKLIASAVGELLKTLPDANVRGLGDTNIRTTISEGIKALMSAK